MVLAACGGGNPATQPPGGGTAGPGPTSGSGQGSSAPTSAPVTAAPQPTPGGNTGGTFSGDPCTLLTAAEIEQVTGVKNAVGLSTPMENFTGGCSWTGDDDTLGAVLSVSTTPDTQSLWGIYTADPEAEPIPGVADGAIYYRGAILVRKGGTILTIGAGPLLADEATRKAAGIELGKIIAAKL
jgi:hypothetical protein